MDAVGAVPPFNYNHSEDLVVDFYADLVKATSLPVYAYNNPETSRFSFTIGTVNRLRDAGLAGMKNSPLNVGFVSRVFYETKLAGTDFQLILGTSTGWLPFYDMGIRAMIGGMSNWAPEIMTALVAATESGDRPSAELLYVVMLDISARCTSRTARSPPTWACTREALTAGLPVDRWPSRPAPIPAIPRFDRGWRPASAVLG